MVNATKIILPQHESGRVKIGIRAMKMIFGSKSLKAQTQKSLGIKDQQIFRLESCLTRIDLQSTEKVYVRQGAYTDQLRISTKYVVFWKDLNRSNIPWDKINIQKY